MLTRSVARSVRRALPVGAGRAARTGLALAAVGIAIVGATSGTAFAGLGQFNRPSPDGGPAVRTHGVHAADGERQASDRKAGQAAAKPKPKSTPKSDAAAGAAAKTGTAKAKTRAATKARTNARVAQRNKVAHKAKAKVKATWKAPKPAPVTDPGVGTVTGAVPPATTLTATTPTSVIAAAAGTATAAGGSAAASALTVSWTIDASATGIVDHFVATAVEDRTKTCRTPTNAATSCKVASLTAGSTYTFTVRAIGVPGTVDSDPSAASAPVAVADPARGDIAGGDPSAVSDGMIVVPGALTRQDAAGATALGAKKTTVQTQAQTKAQTAAKANATSEKANERTRTRTATKSKAGPVAGQARDATALDRMGLPTGAANEVVAARTAQPDGGARTGVRALLGFGLLAAGLAAFGVTRLRRSPLKD